MQNLGRVVAYVFQRIAGVVRQSAAMAEHVAQRDLARHPRVMHCKFGIVANDRVVTCDQSVADERRDHRRSDGLRQRRELENRVGIDGLGLACLPDAEAFEVDDLILVDDGDGQARYASSFQRFEHEIVQVWKISGFPSAHGSCLRTDSPWYK